jgi:hypothetical protein
MEFFLHSSYASLRGAKTFEVEGEREREEKK